MNDDILERLQADVFAVLKRTPSLALVNVLSDNEGDLENRVIRALQTLDDPQGKLGLAVAVMLPEVVSADKNLPGPPLNVQIEIQCIEQVMFNRDVAQGTLIRSSQAAMRVMGALHLHCLGDTELYADKDPLKPIKVKAGYVSHVVTMMVRAAGLVVGTKPLGVSAAVVDDKYVLTCGTAGATIYYTTDGSYPAPGAGGSLGYTAPLVLAAGTRVRCAAYVISQNPGDVLEFRAT